MLPIVLVAFICEVALQAIPNDYKLKRRYLDKNALQIETLILGSSHALYGINPEYFATKTFNGSNISQSINYDYQIIKKYEKDLKNLKTLILPLSYFTLFRKLEDGTQAWRIKNYVIYYGINTPHSFTDYSELLSVKFELNLRRIQSNYIKNKNNITCSKLGWGNDFKSENSKDLEKTGKTAALRHSKDSTNYNENFNTLNKIIALCKKNNVKVMLLTTPTFATYRENLNKKQLQITLNAAQKMIATHDNCYYVNLFKDTSFIASDFYDADHLNELGAKKLSLLLNKKITQQR
jgi:hypothetical protein